MDQINDQHTLDHVSHHPDGTKYEHWSNGVIVKVFPGGGRKFFMGDPGTIKTSIPSEPDESVDVMKAVRDMCGG